MVPGRTSRMYPENNHILLAPSLSQKIKHSRLCAGHRWYATCAGTRSIASRTWCWRKDGGRCVEWWHLIPGSSTTTTYHFPYPFEGSTIFLCKDIVLEWARYWTWFCLFAYFRSKKDEMYKSCYFLVSQKWGFWYSNSPFGGMPSYYHHPDTHFVQGFRSWSVRIVMDSIQGSWNATIFFLGGIKQ